MDTPGPHTIANRGPPISLTSASDVDAPPTGSSLKSKRWTSESAHSGHDAPVASSAGDVSMASKLQDRVFDGIFQRIFPQDYVEDDSKSDVPSIKYAQKPNFSLPVMSSNFRKLNARIGVVFAGQASAIKVLSWDQPTQTLSFLAIYSFCCIEPHLLVVLPLAICLLSIMIPAFTARHPPPPNSVSTDVYHIGGPASERPPEIKPAPEMSKDFFRNMRDLQNTMGDFVVVHDLLVNSISPLTNFSDERLSSTIFLGLFSSAAVMFLASGLVPWRFIALLAGWVGIFSGHPMAIQLVQSIDKRPIRHQIERAHKAFQNWIIEDIVMDETPEKREVEIFELQRRSDNSWEPWIFALSPYTPRSPLRVSGDRPRGARFFEDVQPPKGWEWSSKKWALDVFSREWVEARMITAVKIETDGMRWVYDVPDDIESPTDEGSALTKRAEADKTDWEAGFHIEAKGEWRRRRWTRRVQRRIVSFDADS